MPATSTIVGASLGLGVQLYSNAVRKLPLLRSACPTARAGGAECRFCAPTLSALARCAAADPWEHVIATGLGGMVGSYVVAWEVRAQRSAAAQLPALRGLS